MKLSKLRILIAALILSIAALPIFANTNTSAASTKNFDPGNIISDATMSNYNSMSVAKIQSFLKSKNSCNDRNISKAAMYSSYSYHIENGHFVCMADETFNGKSAAQIIYNAAQTYRINPQVLIVLLQKEQGLVTDTWPNSRQYRSATGYGCPDTAACDTKYYGFENQVNNAAALFRNVLDGGWSNYLPGYRYIAYNPNSACGGSTVYVQNRATAALYRYTPYQPNASALAAGYGTGNPCGAYGNRNFYLYFMDWFGNPTSGSSTSSSGSNAAATPTVSAAPVVKTFDKNSLPRTYVPDGHYEIVTLAGKALDVAGNSTANGANIHIYDHSSTNTAQIFILTRDSDGFYTITGFKSGKVIDVSGASTASGVNIQTWTSNRTCAQKWAINVVDGHYTFRSACSGNAIDVAAGAISTNYTNVWSYAYNASAAQQFDLIYRTPAPVTDGTYSVITHSGKDLDVASNLNIQIANRNESAAQSFNFTRTKDGFYRITQASTGKALAAANNTAGSGTNVQLAANDGSCSQKWAIEQAAKTQYRSGFFSIRSACSGAALDVTGGLVGTAGKNVQVYTSNNSLAQIWTFAEVDYSYLTEGTYDITDVFGSHALDFADHQATLGAKLASYDPEGADSAEFRFQRTADGYYQIINVSSGYSLTLQSTTSAYGINVTLQPTSSSCANKWFFSKYASHIIINSACNGYALMATKSGSRGAPIATAENSHHMCQLWHFVRREA